MNKTVWLVIGSSKGIGANLVKSLLENGHYVIMTSRNK
ncbi:short-subunit dehydrogenase [Enterococcus rivorum]|nr:short-subunit dehydrogenase [Enterococcus rivorum]